MTGNQIKQSGENVLTKLASHHRKLDWKHYSKCWIDGVRNRREFSNVHTYLMFIGYPRSGHSLVGAQLTAHKNMMIAHELHALQYFKLGYRRNQLFQMIRQRDEQFVRRDCQNGKYKYLVPGQWQGQCEELTVIGDKKGGGSTKLLYRYPEMLSRLQKALRVRVRIIHVVRNPYDSIARIMLIAGSTLEMAMQRYFNLCRGTDSIIKRNRDNVLTLSHESFVANPQQALASIGRFAGVEMGDDYLNDCASVVFKSPRLTRNEVEWSTEIIQKVESKMTRFRFLAGYEFNENGEGKKSAA